MTTRRDVDRLARAGASAVELARTDLVRLVGVLDFGQPDVVRDALLEAVPVLVREYGDVAATAAAEWYEEVRAAQVGGSYSAQLGAGADPDDVTSSVRWAAGHLYGDNPQQAIANISGAIQRHILYSGRETVARNARHDPANPRFARVPRGRKTCAFCELVASRGFVYFSQVSAGGEWNQYHDDCDCQIVPEWDRDGAHIEGYDPDAMFDRYQTARASAGQGASENAILAEMRRLYPDDYTDGVIAE